MASQTKQQSETNSPVIAMRGAGYYSANTVGAKAVIDAAADLVLEVLESMQLQGSTPFAIAGANVAPEIVGAALFLLLTLISYIWVSRQAKP